MCDKKFNRNTKAESYDAHMRTHQGLKPWPCKENNCDKSFYKRTSLQLHLTQRHFDESKGAKRPEFVCVFNGCDKVYTLKVNIFFATNKFRL